MKKHIAAKKPRQTGGTFPQCDIVIIGAGILGTVLAAHLTKVTKREIVVFVGSDDRHLQTDTLRSQSWLQSGLLYSGPTTSSQDSRMFVEGRALLSEFGVTAAETGGVFSFASTSEVDRFKMVAKGLNLSEQHEIVQLEDIEAKDLLGTFYNSYRFHFRVPDSQFDPALVMEVARKEAQLHGVEFVEEEAKLIGSGSFDNEYRVRTTAGQILSPVVTIVCAGCGTPSLLKQLNIDHSIVVFRSILIRTTGTLGLRVPIYADRSTGITAVMHQIDSVPPASCLVLGDWRRQRVQDGKEQERTVKLNEVKRLLSQLPDDLRDAAASGIPIAGHKTEVRKSGGRRSVDPWIQYYPEYPGLIAAVPGKATMALFTAKRIAEMVEKMQPLRRRFVSTASVLGRRSSPFSSTPFQHVLLSGHNHKNQY